MNRLPLILLTAISLFTMTGCALNSPLLKPGQSSRQEYVNSHPELSPDIKQAILDGKVIKGMTKEDVRISWGQPTTIDDFSADPKAWWYEEDSEGWWYKGLVELTKFVKFKHGRVVDITTQYK